MKNAPAGLWGSAFKANLNGKMIDNMLMGFRISPKAKEKPEQTEDKPVSDFAYDIELKQDAYDWMTSLNFTPENPDNDEERRNTIKRIKKVGGKRNKILSALGLDPDTVNLDGLVSDTMDAFLVAPEVYSLS